MLAAAMLSCLPAQSLVRCAAVGVVKEVKEEASVVAEEAKEEAKEKGEEAVAAAAGAKERGGGNWRGREGGDRV